jgi:hypothetical protein
MEAVAKSTRIPARQLVVGRHHVRASQNGQLLDSDLVGGRLTRIPPTTCRAGDFEGFVQQPPWNSIAPVALPRSAEGAASGGHVTSVTVAGVESGGVA